MEETLPKKEKHIINWLHSCDPLRGCASLRTLHVVLEDLCKHGEEGVLEAADSGGVGLAGDADRQAEGLKQVVVKVRLAGILKTTFQGYNIPLLLDKPPPTHTENTVQVCFTLLTKRSL